MPSRLLRLVAVAVIALVVVGRRSSTPGPSAATSLHYLYVSGSQTDGKEITLRIQLTEPAPAGGAVVTLSASHGAVNVPGSAALAAGQTEKTITGSTDPVATETAVTVVPVVTTFATKS